MNQVDKITSDFFCGAHSVDGVIPDISMINMKRVLNLLTGVREHASRIEAILKLSCYTGVSVLELHNMLESNLKEAGVDNLVTEPLAGSKVTVIKEHTALWSPFALYWSYGFDTKTNAEILAKYNPKIGDIALKFVEFQHRMKQQENETGDDKHNSENFYAFAAVGKVRAIEFLVIAEKQNSKYLRETYLDVEGDLDLNFFDIQNTNKWDGEALTTVKAKSIDKHIMKYDNEEEGLSFQIRSSRMLKDGSVNSFRPAYYKTIQLYSLEGKIANSRYDSMAKAATTKAKVGKVTIEPIVEELDIKLIRPKVKVLRGATPEEQVEAEVMARPKHRGSISTPKCSSKNVVADNEHSQHLQNRALSASLIINESMLASDYTIAEFEHLSLFAARAISVNNDLDKLCAATFMLMVVLGSKFTDLMDMLAENKDALLAYKDGTLTTQIDKNLFAGDVNDFLEKNKHTVKFNIPHLMGIVISKLIFLVKSEEKPTEELYQLFEDYLKNAVARFEYKIDLKPKKLYRTLKRYTKENSNDLLSGLIATGVYTQGDRARLAYTTVRTNSAKQSDLITNLWINLGFDVLARKIMGFADDHLPTLRGVEIPKLEFSGSSKYVKPQYSKEFFRVLRASIAEYDVDSDEAFNLISIGVRYSMSLLVGTRNFKNSANFESISFSDGMLMISEKATSISAGLRVIPLCDTINSLLQKYNTDFLEPRGLSKDVWLVSDGKATLFTAKKAYSFLKSLSNLKDIEVCQQYVENVPLNTGRHGFTRFSIEQDIPTHFIGAYMGHNTAGGEQLGVYSTMDVQSYKEAVRGVTSKMASEHGVKDRLW